MIVTAFVECLRNSLIFIDIYKTLCGKNSEGGEVENKAFSVQ